MNEFRYGRRAVLLAGLGSLAATATARPTVLRVGPQRAVKTLAAAAREAREGMTVEVDAGDYLGDVASWPQKQLTLKAVGGRVRLIAAGMHAEGKGIFVMKGEEQRIEGFDFIGAAVPDRNGAGIRLERGSLFLKDCSFRDSENGLLTSNDPELRLEIEDCEFGAIRRQDGHTHNLYVGRIGWLRVTGCHFHHGRVGHLLKSRAAVSEILYNRLADDIGGEASYELEFPNGGQALVVGNVIQQSSTTQNALMVSYGAEGYLWPRNELRLLHNTLVDLLPGGGSYLRVAPGPGVRVQLVNNLLSGSRALVTRGDWDVRHNPVVDWDAFAQAARGNYALKPGSPLRGTALDLGADAPTRQFRAPRGTQGLAYRAGDPGAIQQP